MKPNEWPLWLRLAKEYQVCIALTLRLVLSSSSSEAQNELPWRSSFSTLCECHCSMYHRHGSIGILLSLTVVFEVSWSISKPFGLSWETSFWVDRMIEARKDLESLHSCSLLYRVFQFKQIGLHWESWGSQAYIEPYGWDSTNLSTFLAQVGQFLGLLCTSSDQSNSTHHIALATHRSQHSSKCFERLTLSLLWFVFFEVSWPLQFKAY